MTEVLLINGLRAVEHDINGHKLYRLLTEDENERYFTEDGFMQSLIDQGLKQGIWHTAPALEAKIGKVEYMGHFENEWGVALHGIHVDTEEHYEAVMNHKPTYTDFMNGGSLGWTPVDLK